MNSSQRIKTERTRYEKQFYYHHRRRSFFFLSLFVGISKRNDTLHIDV